LGVRAAGLGGVVAQDLIVAPIAAMLVLCHHYAVDRIVSRTVALETDFEHGVCRKSLDVKKNK
jgi:hypothetical protein